MGRFKRGNYGFVKLPRLIEFTDSRLIHSDFTCSHYAFLTLIRPDGEIVEEFAHYTRSQWIRKSDNSLVTNGSLLKTIYAAFGKESVFLDLYVNDINIGRSRDMKVKKIFTYELIYTGVCRDKANHNKNCYTLLCHDDVKMFNNIKQVLELEYS